MILVGATAVYYTYTSFHRIWRFSFGDPSRWNEHWRVDPGTVIEFGPRLGYALIWGALVLVSALAFLAGLALFNRVRKGELFTEATAIGIRRLGFALGFAMIIEQIYACINVLLITRFNTDPSPIAWAYDPSDIKTFILAVILFLFGWVMRETIAIEAESKEFV